MIPANLAKRWRDEGRYAGQTLCARLTQVCAERPDALALIDGDVRLSFARAEAAIEQLAGWFETLLDAPGEVVSWQLPNWWEAAIVHHAALRAGAVPNPLSVGLRDHELRLILAEARPSVLVVPHTLRGHDHLAMARTLQAELGIRAIVLVRARPQPRTFDLTHLLATTPPTPAGPPPTDPGSLALLLYTSGTTADPKGVQHSHEGLLCEIDSFRTIHDLTPADRNLGGAPVGHIAGLVYGLLAPFALGTSTALLERWNAVDALELIERERVTFMTGPPTFLQSLAAAKAEHDTASFRLFSTGGASIPTEAVRAAGARLGCLVKRAYGSSEVPTLTATRIDDDERARLETDGRAIGGGEVRIVRPDGADAAAGEEGEIHARAPEMFVAYRNPALTAHDDDGWFATGDLGVVDADDLLRVTGRIKDIIIRGGENISAPEIEELLLRHADVTDVAVVGAPDERLGERVCAFVVVRVPVTLATLTTFLTEHGLAKHKLPERLEVRASLPKTESGKVRKDDLRAWLQQGAEPRAHIVGGQTADEDPLITRGRSAREGQ